MKAGRLILGVVGLLLVVVVAGVAYLAAYLDQNRDLLERGVSKALGREVRIEDGVTVHWSMTPSVALEGLWVGNPDWANGSYLARARRAVLSFDLAALLSRRLEVRRVRLENADLLLETANDGRHNWTIGGRGGGGVELTIGELEVDESSLKYHSSHDDEYVLSVPKLRFESGENGRLVLEGSLNYQDVPLFLSGSIEKKAGVGTDARGFSLQVEIPDATLVIAGDVSGIRDFSRLQFDLQSDRLDLRKWFSPLWPSMAFDGSLKQLTARFNTAGNTTDLLIRNAGGELKIASADIAPAADKGARVGSVALDGLSVRVVPDKGVQLQTALAYSDQAYQIRLSGGSLADLFEGAKSWDRLKLSAKGKSAGRPVEIAGELGPWSAGQGTGGLEMDLSLQHGGLKVGLKGILAHFDSLQGSRFVIKASAPSLDRLTPWLGVGMPKSAPFTFSAKAVGAKHDLDLKELKLTAGESDISGKMRIPLAKGGRIEAVLESRALDLKPFLVRSGQGAADSSPIMEWELPADALQGLDGSLRYKVERLKTDDMATMKAIGLDATLDKGHLKFTLSAAGERMTADVDLRPTGEHWRLALTHKGKLILGSFIDHNQPVVERSWPPVETELTLQASGRSIGSMLDSADGKFLMVLGPGRLNKQLALDLPLGDVLFTLLNTISPSGKSEQRGELECAVMQLDIAKGIATSSKGLALRTERMNVIGGGALKLSSGEIDLRFKTAQRKGLGIGLLGIADRLVRLTGTVEEPAVALNVGGALGYGAAAWASGGLTVVYDTLFSRLTAFSNPCDAVLESIGKRP